MRGLFSLAIILITCSFSIAQDNALQNKIDRNPFNRNKTTLEPSSTQIKEVSAPIPVPGAAPEEEKLIIRPAIPQILNDLRSIAIAKNGKRLALFGRRIIALDEEIEGFRVTAISLDKVILARNNEELVIKIDDASKNRDRNIKNNQVQNNSNATEQNWSSIFGSLNPDGAMNMDDDSMNMLNRINQIRGVIQPFLDKTMQNNAPAERRR